jgi:hypothetical protein
MTDDDPMQQIYADLQFVQDGVNALIDERDAQQMRAVAAEMKLGIALMYVPADRLDDYKRRAREVLGG